MPALGKAAAVRLLVAMGMTRAEYTVWPVLIGLGALYTCAACAGVVLVALCWGWRRAARWLRGAARLVAWVLVLQRVNSLCVI